MRIILGSSSPRRRWLLKGLGFRFEVKRPDIDETPLNNESPMNFVKRAARDKLDVILKRYKVGKDTLIITADTIVVLGKRILGKPKNKKEAFLMLRTLQNRWHRVYTAFCIYYNEKIISRLVKTDVRFRKLSNREIRDYIDSGEPMDKAGAYAAQGKGAAIIKEIHGSYTNVVGLPIAELIEEINGLKIQSKF